MADTPTTISEASVPAQLIAAATRRAETALSLYAPGRANKASLQQLIIDLLTLGHVKGWDQPSPTPL
jgi:hypothetical protein